MESPEVSHPVCGYFVYFILLLSSYSSSLQALSTFYTLTAPTFISLDMDFYPELNIKLPFSVQKKYLLNCLDLNIYRYFKLKIPKIKLQILPQICLLPILVKVTLLIPVAWSKRTWLSLKPHTQYTSKCNLFNLQNIPWNHHF